MNISSKDMLTLHNNNALTNDESTSDVTNDEQLILPTSLPNVKRDNSLALLIDDACSMETSDTESSLSNDTTTLSVNKMNSFGDLESIFDTPQKVFAPISTTTTTSTSNNQTVSDDELEKLFADPEHFASTIPDDKIDSVLDEIDTMFMEEVLNSNNNYKVSTDMDQLDNMLISPNVSNPFIVA